MLTQTQTAYPIMACGHTANAHQGGKPVCVICLGVKPGADQVAENQPALTGRTAVCSGCRKSTPSTAPSSFSLPFFAHRPGQSQDTYYCGCFGWE